MMQTLHVHHRVLDESFTWILVVLLFVTGFTLSVLAPTAIYAWAMRLP